MQLSALSAWNWKRQPPMVVCRLLGSDTEAGSSHMTNAVTCTANGGRAASGQPGWLSERIHSSTSNCLQEACGGSGVCLLGQIKCHLLARQTDRRRQVRGALILKITRGRSGQTGRHADQQTDGGHSVIDGKIPTFI